MILFKSKLRRKIEIEILKLRMQRSEIEREKKLTKSNDTKKQVDLIIRCKSIDDKIELYRQLLTN